MTGMSASDIEIEQELASELSAAYSGAPALDVQAAHLELLHAEQQAMFSTPASSTTRRAAAGVLGAAAAAVAIALFGLNVLDDGDMITATSIEQPSEAVDFELEVTGETPVSTTVEQPTPSTTEGPLHDETNITQQAAGQPSTEQGGNSAVEPARSESTPLTTNPPPQGTSVTVNEPVETSRPWTTRGPSTTQGHIPAPSTPPTTPTESAPTTDSTPTTEPAPTTTESAVETSTPEITTTVPADAMPETVLGDEPLDLTELECDGYPVTLAGSNGDDILVGTSAPDVIFAGNGHDTIYGLAGNDIICAGNGNDLIVTGAGLDIAFGDNGFDSFEGGP